MKVQHISFIMLAFIASIINYLKLYLAEGQILGFGSNLITKIQI